MIQTNNNISFAFLKNIFIFYLLLIFLIVIPSKKIYALSNDWVEVPQSKYGRQFWDKKSIKRNQDGSVRVRSKFIPKTKNEITQDIFYTMDINCFEKSFRDIDLETDRTKKFVSENTNWEEPSGDILILGVIGQVCNSIN